MKKILIDARMYGTKHTGIGRYVKNLLAELKNLPDFAIYQWVLLVYSEQLDEIKNDLGSAYSYVPVSIKHYSANEQFVLPGLINSIAPDLVHFTHFNKAVFYRGKSLVTIHDLIKHFSKGRETTTKSAWLYWPKYWMYRLICWMVIKSSWLIVPSNYWRDFLLENYGLNNELVTTTYEAVDNKFIELGLKKTNSKIESYIVYTGNLYPHKNIEVVFRALKLMPELSLKIICSRSIFSERAIEKAKKYGVQRQVELLGYLKDEDFLNIYRSALALVHPAFYEGFSLTGLEAMALDCPVIAAKASCLPEIYGDSVLYFDPKNENELVATIRKLMNDKTLRRKMIKRGKEQVLKYSWKKTAKNTFEVYKKILS